MYRGETDIARDTAAATLLLQVCEEGAQQRRREVVDRKAINRLLPCFAQIRQQEDQRITIAGLCIASKIAVCDEIFQQESAHPRTEQGTVTHGGSPVERSARNADWPRASARWSY